VKLHRYHKRTKNMKTTYLLALTALLTLSACDDGGEAGAECTADEDCAEGLECHFHDDHGDEDHEGEEEEEHGECEAHDDHEDE
jgi:hypothetical protein